MAKAISLMHNDPNVKELLALLEASGSQSGQKYYSELLDYVDTITQQYNSILSELDTLKEKLSGITDKKNPLTIMVENLENLASNIETKLADIKNSIILTTKNTLETVKEKGLSALGSAFNFLQIKDGLQIMSKGLAKSIEALNKAVVRVENLEQHNREKNTVLNTDEEMKPVKEQVKSLSELLVDTRLDFENLSQDELKVVYDKLLEIGMDNSLTTNENVCLQSLVDEVSDLLPSHSENEADHEIEKVSEQDMEM